MSKHEEVQRQISGLREAVPELKGILLASVEGLPIAHLLPNGADPQRLAAMAAAASSLGRRISETLGVGPLLEISVTGSDGKLFVYAAGAKTVLAVMGPHAANAGLIHLEARETAHGISELF